MNKKRLAFLILTGLIFALTVAYFVAFKRGVLPANPQAFAGLVAALLVFLVAEFAYTVYALLRRRVRPITGIARTMIMSGLLLAFGAGMINWLFSLQGAVILFELEAIPLSATSHLQEFEAGLFSNVDEMQMTMQLEKLVLRPGGSDTFTPFSRIRLLQKNEEPVILEVSPRKSDSVGTLYFHQGAFGFAPRIVILKEGGTVFDQVVPFLTRVARDASRPGFADEGSGSPASTGMTFQGDFAIEKEGLAVKGAVSLDSLDEEMRGHTKLLLSVKKGDLDLGSGELMPGYFADLQQGYRIGFAGLKRWSEIDISRKNYPLPMLAGAGMVLIGLLVWPVALWRKW